MSKKLEYRPQLQLEYRPQLRLEYRLQMQLKMQKYSDVVPRRENERPIPSKNQVLITTFTVVTPQYQQSALMHYTMQSFAVITMVRIPLSV